MSIPGHRRFVNGSLNARFGRFERGYSLIELTMAIAIGIVMTAIAIPQVQSGINNYRLRGAVASATWAIQSTRYQALSQGYPFQVVLNATTNQYQITSQPPGTSSFSNVGNPVPLSGSPITLDQNTTLQFKPNGAVTAPVGTLNFTISYQGLTKTITVSNYGNISVTP
jgi:Tfp pilus assembly protein FimT